MAQGIVTGRLTPDDDLLVPGGYTHLQTGGVGAMPRPVFDATVAAMRELEADPVGGTYGPGIGAPGPDSCQGGRPPGVPDRRHGADQQRDRGHVSRCAGLEFKAGDRILITDHEHPGGRLGWEWAARRYGAVVDTVAISPAADDPQAIVAQFAEAIRPETRLISFSQILFTTGVQLPAAELCALARDRGCWRSSMAPSPPVRCRSTSLRWAATLSRPAVTNG